ncbi:MAG: zf-TFIIB domain-containing protein [Anaerolineae bacterium]|nr:zf-TFIIB domain-containing protein [Anaerolineae bacterium]
MKCPIDNTELLISERQGIEIDYCPKCRGIWLDRGELDKMIDRVLADEQQRYPTTSTNKRKNDAYVDDDGELRYEDGSYTNEQSRRERYDEDGQKRCKKRSMLEDIFDIFD